MLTHSAIYRGKLNHNRISPRRHNFTYSVFMMYLDLDELEEFFSISKLWSMKRMALARLKRTDFIGDKSGDETISIKDGVIQRIKEVTGDSFEGSVRMLANLRYFGFAMNPIVSYYCFDKNENLRFVVAEVTNTPWREKYAYVLKCHPNCEMQRIRFNKLLHVSPFNPMDVEYEWKSNAPNDRIFLQLANWRNEIKEFSATLTLQREVITEKSLRRTILGYPFMTIKVCLAIYWQAMRLYLKGVKFVDHPRVSSVLSEK